MRGSVPSLSPMAGSRLACPSPRYRANSSSVLTRIFSWSNNPVGRAAWRNTSTGSTPSSSTLRASVVATRNWLVIVLLPSPVDIAFCLERRLLQGGHVDDEAVLHVALRQPVVGFVDPLDWNHLDVGRDPVLGAEVQHLLGLPDA